MRSPAPKYPREMQGAGPLLGPTPEPICNEPDCLMCVIKRQDGETRAEFVARLARLYDSGRLSGGHGSW